MDYTQWQIIVHNTFKYNIVFGYIAIAVLFL